MYRSKYTTNHMFKYIIINPFNQSVTNGTSESYLFMMEYQMVRINMNNLMDRLLLITMVEMISNLKVMKRKLSTQNWVLWYEKKESKRFYVIGLPMADRSYWLQWKQTDHTETKKKSAVHELSRRSHCVLFLEIVILTG